MDREFDLIIPMLEILEIEGSNILYSPRNTGGGRSPPGVRLLGAWIIFGTLFLKFPDIMETLEIL